MSTRASVTHLTILLIFSLIQASCHALAFRRALGVRDLGAARARPERTFCSCCSRAAATRCRLLRSFHSSPLSLDSARHIVLLPERQQWPLGGKPLAAVSSCHGRRRPSLPSTPAAPWTSPSSSSNSSASSQPHQPSPRRPEPQFAGLILGRRRNRPRLPI